MIRVRIALALTMILGAIYTAAGLFSRLLDVGVGASIVGASWIGWGLITWVQREDEQ